MFSNVQPHRSSLPCMREEQIFPGLILTYYGPWWCFFFFAVSNNDVDQKKIRCVSRTVSWTSHLSATHLLSPTAREMGSIQEKIFPIFSRPTMGRSFSPPWKRLKQRWWGGSFCVLPIITPSASSLEEGVECSSSPSPSRELERGTHDVMGSVISDFDELWGVQVFNDLN